MADDVKVEEVKVEEVKVEEVAAAVDVATSVEEVEVPVEDLKNLSNEISVKDLAALDATDPTAAAALRSQMNWEEDAKRLFKGETEDEKRQRELLSAMDKRDNEEAVKRRADEEARAKAEELKTLDESLVYLVQERDDLKVRQDEVNAEIKRLQSLRKAG